MLARLGEPETYGKLLVALQEEEPGKEYTVRKFEIRDEKVYMSTYVGTFCSLHVKEQFVVEGQIFHHMYHTTLLSI